MEDNSLPDGLDSLFGGRAAKWVWFVLGWAALCLLFAPEAYLSFYFRDAPISWRETFELTVVNSAISLLFVPLIVALTRKFPFERRIESKALLAHFAACLAFSVLHSCLYAVACHAWHDVGGTLFYRFHPNLLTYWAVVGFTQALDYFRKYQTRERQVRRLELEALKAQLQPHFLFNALHTISAMMHVDVRGAERMITRLSDLLRMTLANIGKQQVRLVDELAYVEAYLEIERTRFGERLATTIHAGPEELEALVPASILQPLVENCVRHGLSPQQRDGLIDIRAERVGSVLMLSVTDNGRGLPRGIERHRVREGIGLSNIRRRLEQLHPGNFVLRLEPRSTAGVQVVAEFPFRTATADRVSEEPVGS